MNPFVFIVGCPRSGTTLLQRIVDAHPHIAITPETHWIPRWFDKRKGLTPEGLATPRLVSKLLEYHRFPRLQINQEALENLMSSGEPVAYPSFVTGIYDLYGKAQGKPLVGDKTPDYVRTIPTLHALWPRAKFVHLIRDGRDVCLSTMNWSKVRKGAGRFATWMVDAVATTALWWEWNVRLGREIGSSLGPELYYEMRYESLVADPAHECAALCAFLGVPYNDAMLRFHEGRTRTDPGLDAKHAWLPVTPGLRDWQSQMPAEDVERWEAVAGDLLDELRYARAAPHLPAETLKHTARLRDSFTQEVRSRGHLLPKRW